MTMEQKKTQLKEQIAYHPYYSKEHPAPPIRPSAHVGAREVGSGRGRHPGDGVQALYGHPAGGQVRPPAPTSLAPT